MLLSGLCALFLEVIVKRRDNYVSNRQHGRLNVCLEPIVEIKRNPRRYALCKSGFLRPPARRWRLPCSARHVLHLLPWNCCTHSISRKSATCKNQREKLRKKTPSERPADARTGNHTTTAKKTAHSERQTGQIKRGRFAGYPAAPPLRPLRRRSACRPRPRPPHTERAALVGHPSAADRGPLACAAARLRWARRRRSSPARPPIVQRLARAHPGRAASCAANGARPRCLRIHQGASVANGCTPFDALQCRRSRAALLLPALLVQQAFALLGRRCFATRGRPPPSPPPFTPYPNPRRAAPRPPRGMRKRLQKGGRQGYSAPSATGGTAAPGGPASGASCRVLFVGVSSPLTLRAVACRGRLRAPARKARARPARFVANCRRLRALAVMGRALSGDTSSTAPLARARCPRQGYRLVIAAPRRLERNQAINTKASDNPPSVDFCAVCGPDGHTKSRAIRPA